VCREFALWRHCD